MNSMMIIARSEFLRRATSKVFIITTLLAPIGLIVFIAITVLASIATIGGDDPLTIAVVDETGFVLDRILEEEFEHTLVRAGVAAARDGVLTGRYDGYVTIPSGVATGEESVSYYALEGEGYGAVGDLRRSIRTAVRDHRIEEAGISEDVLDIVNTRVFVESVRLSPARPSAEESSTEAYPEQGGFGLGMTMGLLIYMGMLVYSSVLMQGIIAEKQTRIVEIILSSARPFNLLMGKVLGIGATGLVQLMAWVLILLAITTFGGMIVVTFFDPALLGAETATSTEELLAAADISLPTLRFGMLVWCILFFLGGFLLYAGLFAAIGSMVEQPQDAQGFMLPVMLPLIASLMFMAAVLESPNSSLAVILSMIPFTAPVSMIMRMAATNVPFWEVLASYMLMVAGFTTTMWVASRIYRVGILMYGKKASVRDAIRWFRHA